jgi:hypothetical protein
MPMPIDKQEFQNGKIHSTLEEEILTFLSERRDRAFTSQEIMEGIHYHTEFSTPEISKMSTFAISDFTAFLHDLVEKGKINMKIVRGRMYIVAGNGAAKCPKCGTEIAHPRKTWKMAGRPNKQGVRTELQIGLFQCPTHGAFRTVLNKRKISTAPPRKRTAKQKKKRPTKKRVAKKKAAKKKRKRKKPSSLLLI